MPGVAPMEDTGLWVLFRDPQGRRRIARKMGVTLAVLLVATAMAGCMRQDVLAGGRNSTEAPPHEADSRSGSTEASTPSPCWRLVEFICDPFGLLHFATSHLALGPTGGDKFGRAGNPLMMLQQSGQGGLA